MSNAEILKKSLLAGYHNLEKNKDHVNDLNVFPVPDGDTGTNMSLTMRSAVKNIMEVQDINITSIAKAASNGSLMGARGNSGVILSQILRGFYKGFKEQEEITPLVLRDGFVKAYETAYKAVMKPTEGTILTVIREMGEFANKNVDLFEDTLPFLREIIAKGNESLRKTPELLPVLKEAGVVDSGGKGLMVILEGCLNYSDENFVSEETSVSKKYVEEPTQSAEEIEFGYCTEFLIQATDADAETFREKITPLGDCVIVVKGEDIVKTHIHTNHPGKVLEYALQVGALKDIKIENMRFQHEHLLADEQELQEAKNPQPKKEHKKYAFITVSSGKGLNRVFESLGVDRIIMGGQTMNPSTEDIGNAIEELSADHIFILPNNKNIIMAANQTKHLTNQHIHVLETKSIPQGIAAMISFDANREFQENVQAMEEAVSEIRTGQVTYSVRDTKIGNVNVKKDDIIGLDEKEIRAVGKDINKVSFDLVSQLIQKDSVLVTLYYGDGIDENMAQRLGEMIEEKYDDLDIEIMEGAQPIYYYMISVE